MNRSGNPARVSNLVTARRALVLVLIALLVLFVVYPTAKKFRCSNIHSSSVFIQHPDITPSTYDAKPAIDEETSSTTVAEVASLLQHVAPQPLVLKRGISKYDPCYSEQYFARGHCQVNNCVNTYRMFEFWYPGCEKAIADWEYYMSYHYYHTDDAYRHHYWEMPLNEDDELDRRTYLDQSLEVSARRGDMPLPDTRLKQLSLKLNRPERPNPPNLPRLNSFEDFVGNHGPIAVANTEVSTLEDRSPEITDSTLKTPADVPIFDGTTHNFKCPVNKLNGTFCIGDFPGASYIIRCEGGIGQTGSCGANLAGHPPIEMTYTQCWETSPTSGDAACIVYPDHGGNFTLPGCTPSRPKEYKTVERGIEIEQVVDLKTFSQAAVDYNSPETSSERKAIVRSERGGPLPYNTTTTTTTYTCPAYNPNGRFCAGGHGAPIIIRCHDGIGQPGNCNNNLVGSPTLGNAYSPCWETSPISGDTACSKNCIVYPEDGRPSFSLSNCTPRRGDPSLEATGINDEKKDIIRFLPENGILSYNQTSNTFECPAYGLNATFCYGEVGLGRSTYIVRCLNGVGQMENCNNNLAGYPPRGNYMSPCWETSKTSGDAACSKNCIVYPDPLYTNDKPFFTWPGCKSYLNQYLNSREIDEESAELDPMFVPNPHAPVMPKPKPRPNRPPPHDQRTRALESEGSFAQKNSDDEKGGCPRTCQGKYCCNGKRDTDELSTDLDPACSPRMCNSPKSTPLEHPVPPLGEDANARVLAETYAQKISVRDSEHGQRPGGCEGEAGCDCGPLHPFGMPPQGRPKGPKANPRESQEDIVGHRLLDRSLYLSEPEHTKSPALRSFNECLKRENGKCLEQNSKRDSDDRSHGPFNGINAGSPREQEPSLVIHSSPFDAFDVQNVAKDCRGKTGSSLDDCIKEIRTKNTRTLCVALVLGILGLLFLTLVVLDKIRRARSRRASMPMLSQRELSNGTEQMNERPTAKYLPTTMDGTNDGWTTWLMRKQEKNKPFSPTPRVYAPRIPSLTLPKPTLATVRKFSGLGPDMENMGVEKPNLMEKWKSDSKLKWSTTL